MTLFKTKQLFLGASMLLVAMLSTVVKPTERMSDRRPAPNLENAIPRSFKTWKEDVAVKPIQVSPDVQAELDKIYSQTLSRTYVNADGQRIMLSIAYGGDQGRAVQVHKPEVCYPMQGFQILSIAKSVMATVSGEIPIMRLVAAQGRRVEPITYWIAVGDTVVRGAFEQNLARIRYGLTGTVPDGVLVRVSSISQNEAGAYVLHDQFVSEMLQAMRADDAARLLGRLSG
jgi:EpsI family protein